MKDEIKEILQDVIDDIYQCGEYIAQAKKLEKVLDYITNLQEENQRLKELCDKYEEEHNNEFKIWKDERHQLLDYESRNEKAIEYNYELQERYCHSALFDELLASKIYEITEKQLNILTGGNKE